MFNHKFSSRFNIYNIIAFMFCVTWVFSVHCTVCSLLDWGRRERIASVRSFCRKHIPIVPSTWFHIRNIGDVQLENIVKAGKGEFVEDGESRVINLYIMTVSYFRCPRTRT